MNVYFIFTDIKGYSTLSEETMITFQSKTCAELKNYLSEYLNSDELLAFNTWGDAIYAVFGDANHAVGFALAYRDFFKNGQCEITGLIPRVAGHFGKATKIEDPLNGGKLNFFGTHVNTAARIEPVTRPGEIFVSKAFRDNYHEDPTEKSATVEFDELGTLSLAKSYRDMDVFRLRRKSEKSQVIDKLIGEDLSDYIPAIPKISDKEQGFLDNFNGVYNPAIFQSMLSAKPIEDKSAAVLLKIAAKAKSLGLYERCLELLDKANNVDMKVNGERVYAVHHLPEFKKIQANALTRLGEYKKAEDIMFGLWHSGHKDADTLSMLAAQYKRRGVFGKTRTEDFEQVDVKQVDNSLLLRACKLYVEAFRKNISDYYPAINAAYLYLIIGGKEKGKGKKLAQHIVNSWEMPSEPNWFLAATLAEAEMLAGESEEALKLFKIAVEEHQPTVFQLQSTTEQVRLYSKLTSSEEELSDILDYLQKQLQMMAV